MKACALGVAVAAAAVLDPELAESRAEAAGGEGRAVVAPEHELARLDPVQGGRLFDDRDRLVGAAAQLQSPGDDLAGAAVDDRHQVRPAVLGDPDARHVELPQLPRPLDPEEAGSLPALERAAALDQLPLPHHPQHTLAVDRHTEPAAHEGADHPVAVGLVGERLGDDRLLDRVRRRSPLRRVRGVGVSVERLPADPADTRHCRERRSPRRRAHESGRRARLSPTPATVFPRSPTRTSCGRAPARARRPCGATPDRPAAPPCRRALLAGLQQLVAPAVVERLRDRVLTTDLASPLRSPRSPASTISSFRCAVNILYFPLLAQPRLLVGRAAHAEPDAGQSLRRYAPPRPSGTPKSATCQHRDPGAGHASRSLEGVALGCAVVAATSAHAQFERAPVKLARVPQCAHGNSPPR